MPELPGGCWVLGSKEGWAVERGTWLSRQVVTRAQGARFIAQAINEYARGRSPLVTNPTAEEVHYVVRGAGRCRIANFHYEVRPGTGFYVPPSAAFGVENPGPGNLVTVSVCCPQDQQDARRVEEREWLPPAKTGAPSYTVREEEREAILVRDRKFKLMVDTELGCRQVTQFIGFIPPSQAPLHHHTYEEAIYILEGSGILHVEGGSCPFAPGASIFLPIRLRHCLENPGPAWIRLLGFFYPSGSPGAAYER
jgi:mannose-6-phosphate isomerase-like protein (cupin superfamily)